MAAWGFYFVVKLILNYQGILRLDVPVNIAFALFLLIPLPRWLGKYYPVRWTRGLVNVALAALLLWGDSWLPPLTDALAMVKQQGLPQKEYIFNFLSRYYDGWMLTAGAGLFLLCLIVDHFVKLVPLTILVMAVLIPATLQAQPETKEVEANIEGFYEGEAIRVVNMKKPESGKLNFDIVFLHICSLAWDDLREVGLDQHVFFKQFQYLYTNFNSVTTYSGPAMIRLLKGNCGQGPHSAIYNDMPNECYTMNVLGGLGFEKWAALNHDGVYGEFAKDLAQFGKLKTPLMNLAGIPANQRMFDDSPVYDEYAVLERWWTLRLKSDKPAALYYNSVSLHDGSHWAADRDWFKRDRKALFHEFALKQLDDFTKFFMLLEKSGRNVVVVFVPEHGLALRGGGTVQVPGLRDIPLPRISIVPVGVKLIGNGFNGVPLRQTVIDKPVSILALAYQLAFFIEKNPFDAGGAIPRRMLDELPATDYVAENASAKVIKSGRKYFMLAKDNRWVELQKNATE